jgi:hypothetical protein
MIFLIWLICVPFNLVLINVLDGIWKYSFERAIGWEEINTLSVFGGPFGLPLIILNGPFYYLKDKIK